MGHPTELACLLSPMQTGWSRCTLSTQPVHSPPAIQAPITANPVNQCRSVLKQIQWTITTWLSYHTTFADVLSSGRGHQEHRQSPALLVVREPVLMRSLFAEEYLSIPALFRETSGATGVRLDDFRPLLTHPVTRRHDGRTVHWKAARAVLPAGSQVKRESKDKERRRTMQRTMAESADRSNHPRSRLCSPCPPPASIIAQEKGPGRQERAVDASATAQGRIREVACIWRDLTSSTAPSILFLLKNNVFIIKNLLGTRR